MSVARSKHACCCKDCYEPHKKYGCGGCIPEWLCAVIVLDKVPIAIDADCCHILKGKLVHNCGEDSYTSTALTCGTISLTLGASIVETTNAYGVDECCLRVVLSSNEDEIIWTICGSEFYTAIRNDPIFSQNFSIIYLRPPYADPVSITGHLEIRPLGGKSNNGQFGNISTNTEPGCNPIKLDPRKVPPDSPWRESDQDPCNRPTLSVATKVANEFLDPTDPDLFANELCWFLSPCHCIPIELCVRYYYTDKCGNAQIVREPITLLDCNYGPLVFNVTRNGDLSDPYDNGGDDTITIIGKLNKTCGVVWEITSTYYGEKVEITKGLTRRTIDEDGDGVYTKRCDPTIPDGNSIFKTDSIYITEECLCAPMADVECPSGCGALKMPSIDVGDPPNTDVDLYCDHAVLTATIVGSCGPIENFQFALWPSAAEVPLSNFPSLGLEPGIDRCQYYLAYDPETRNHEIIFPKCGLDYGEMIGSEQKRGYFTLYFPDECGPDDLQVRDADPSRYLLDWFIFNQCGFNDDNATGTALAPSSFSCDPFELVFDITFPDLPNCECPCTAIQLKITL